MKFRWVFVMVMAAVVVVNMMVNICQDREIAKRDQIIAAHSAVIDSLKILSANNGAIICDYAVLKIPDEKGRE